MKKMFRYLFIFLVLFIYSSCNEHKPPVETKHGFSIKDDLNKQLYFDSVPKRVITLAPNLTEMIYALGVENRLVGNTLFCSYPEAAKKVNKVGDLITLDFEKILSLKPDLVLITMEGNSKDNYEKLKNLGVKMFISNPRNFEGIKKTFSDLGKIFQVSSRAENIIKDWNTRYNKIINQEKNYQRKKAMFLVSLNPIMLAGKNTFINELMTSAGLVNIASSSTMNYPVFNREEILKYNPDYIILENRFLNDINNLVRAYPEWKSVNAFKEKNIVFIDSDLYLTPGPRFVAALEDLFSKIHPRTN